MAQRRRLEVWAKHSERRAKRRGLTRCPARDEAAAASQALPRPPRQDTPASVASPAVAVVGSDGGRRQIRPGTAADSADTSALGSDAAASVGATRPAQTRVAETERGRCGREDTVGLRRAMASTAADADPCPDVPERFRKPTRRGTLARPRRPGVPRDQEAAQEADDAAAEHAASGEGTPRGQPPPVQPKRRRAARQPWAALAPLVAAAWARGLFGVGRRAFRGAGSENHGAHWRRYVSSLVPMVDFSHAWW